MALNLASQLNRGAVPTDFDKRSRTTRDRVSGRLLLVASCACERSELWHRRPPVADRDPTLRGCSPGRMYPLFLVVSIA